MIRVVPFELRHLDTLEPDPEIHGHENHKWTKKIPGDDRFVAASFLLNGKTLGIFGIYFFGRKSARCWAIFSKEIKKYPVALYASIKRSIENAVSLGKAYNFEAQVLSTKPVLKRYIERLGFSYSYTIGHYDIYDRRAS